MTGAARLASGLGIACLSVCVATAPWNAVSVGPVKLAYLALFPAILALAIEAAVERRAPRVPGWVWLLAATIGALCVLSFVWPVDGSYIAQRYAEGFPALPTNANALRWASVLAGAKWIAAVIGLPLAACLALAARPERVRVLAVSWLCGVTASAAVAVSDQLGLSRIGGGVLPSVSFTGREAGLSVHPNHLALSIVMAAPIAVWCSTHAHGPRRALPVVAGLIMAGGLLVGGSRAGFVGAAVAVPTAMLIDPRSRRSLAILAGVAVAVVGALVLINPQLVASVGQRLRFVDNESAATSDTIRAGLGRQAFADFRHSPLRGVGFEVLTQGHDIYLQLLASGGVVLLVGFFLAQIGFIFDAWTARSGPDGLGRALTVAGVTFLVVGVASNQIADLFVYIPFALIAGLRAGTGTTSPWTWPLMYRRATSGPSMPTERSVRTTSAVELVWRELPEVARVVSRA